MENFKLKVKLLQKDSIVPKRAHASDAGLDIFSNEDTKIYSEQRQTIKTGISVEFPVGYYMRVSPKSGLAVKNGIDVLAGVIDSTYSGEILVVLINHSNETFHIKKGNKIAQLIMEKIAIPDIEVVSELSSSERGTKGFGSTGK